MPPLSILIWLPAAFGLVGGLLDAMRRAGRPRSATIPGPSGRAAPPPAQEQRRLTLPGAFAVGGTLAALGLAIAFIADYSIGGPSLQHVTDEVWISELGIHYKLAVTGLNVLLIGLTTILFSAAAIASVARVRSRPLDRPGLYFFHLLLAESAVLGAFLAQDLALFVAFFDLMLIPFYFLIGGWGADRGEVTRVRATLKVVIYTFVGSLLMLAAAIATGVLASQEGGGHLTFVLSSLHTDALGTGTQEWIFLFFAAAFLVKMPAFPLHGWMPDGYRAMPIEVLMVFSGVLSKVGAYGFLAIALPLFPRAAVHFQTLMLLIALASIVYGSVQAFSQRDARLIAGYSSVAQMGFITLGIFALNSKGAQGALLQMVNHGLVVAPMLFIIGLLAARAGGSEDIRDMGGIAFRAPVFASLFLIVTLATLAMPGSSNFVGEFLILLGVFKAKLAIAIVAFAGVVLASVYALRLFIRSMHNRVGRATTSRDIGLLDGTVLVPIVAVILFLAVYPQFALHRSEASVKGAVATAETQTRPASVAELPSLLRAAGPVEGRGDGQPADGSGSAAASPPRGCTRTAGPVHCVVEYRTQIK